MLEQELLEGLQPVAAPAELWNRVGQIVNLRPIVNRPVRGGLTTRRRLTTCPTWLLAAAAAIVVVAGGWSFRPATDSRASVREWVKASAGLDLPLADRAGLRLVATHASRNTAEVGFTVDGHGGRLLMMKTSASASPVPHVPPAPDARIYSWAAGGLAFTLECESPSDLRAACSLCHG